VIRFVAIRKRLYHSGSSNFKLKTNIHCQVVVTVQTFEPEDYRNARFLLGQKLVRYVTI